MQTGRLVRRGVTAVAVLSLALPFGAAAPAGAAPARTAAGAAEPAVPAVAWAGCPDFPAPFQCGTYRVPLDYDRPGAGTIELALLRRPAGDPSRKIGSLFLNPGGPGGEGRGFAAAASERIFNDEIRDRFDIVGFDPRGVGLSTPVQCFGTDEEFLSVLGSVPAVPLGATEVRDTLAAYRTYTTACGANGGPLLAHLSTLNVVKDLDLLRRAVGDRMLTYAGYSYGTLIGATYANLFPGRVRALLLDGMVDPAERTQRSLLNELNRAGGFETALTGFLQACEAAGEDCAFATGADPREQFNQLRERLRREPLTLPDGSVVTISLLTDYVAGQLYDPTAFPETAQTLAVLYFLAFPDVGAGNGRIAFSADDLSSLRARFDAYSFNGVDTLFGVNCLDKRLPRQQAAWPGIARGFEAVHRTFGRWQAYTAAVCATWPVVTRERYDGPWNRRTANTVLIVGTTWDPATPYAFARRATRELGNARLLTHDGYGHTSLLSSTCADEKTNHYLLTGQVPPAGTVCQPDAQPFEPLPRVAADRAALAAATAGS